MTHREALINMVHRVNQYRRRHPEYSAKQEPQIIEDLALAIHWLNNGFDPERVICCFHWTHVRSNVKRQHHMIRAAKTFGLLA